MQIGSVPAKHNSMQPQTPPGTLQPTPSSLSSIQDLRSAYYSHYPRKPVSATVSTPLAAGTKQAEDLRKLAEELRPLFAAMDELLADRSRQDWEESKEAFIRPAWQAVRNWGGRVANNSLKDNAKAVATAPAKAVGWAWRGAVDELKTPEANLMAAGRFATGSDLLDPMGLGMLGVWGAKGIGRRALAWEPTGNALRGLHSRLGNIPGYTYAGDTLKSLYQFAKDNPSLRYAGRLTGAAQLASLGTGYDLSNPIGSARDATERARQESMQQIAEQLGFANADEAFAKMRNMVNPPSLFEKLKSLGGAAAGSIADSVGGVISRFGGGGGSAPGYAGYQHTGSPASYNPFMSQGGADYGAQDAYEALDARRVAERFRPQAADPYAFSDDGMQNQLERARG